MKLCYAEGIQNGLLLNNIASVVRVVVNTLCVWSQRGMVDGNFRRRSVAGYSQPARFPYARHLHSEVKCAKPKLFQVSTFPGSKTWFLMLSRHFTRHHQNILELFTQTNERAAETTGHSEFYL